MNPSYSFTIEGVENTFERVGHNRYQLVRQYWYDEILGSRWKGATSSGFIRQHPVLSRHFRALQVYVHAVLDVLKDVSKTHMDLPEPFESQHPDDSLFWHVEQDTVEWIQPFEKKVLDPKGPWVQNFVARNCVETK